MCGIYGMVAGPRVEPAGTVVERIVAEAETILRQSLPERLGDAALA